jgi:hypothetical protein
MELIIILVTSAPTNRRLHHSYYHTARTTLPEISEILRNSYYHAARTTLRQKSWITSMKGREPARLGAQATCNP